MKLRKIIAAVAASAVAAASLAAVSFAEPVDKGIFVIGFADGDWKAAFWGKSGDALDSSYETTAAYNGDGTYTVKIDLSKGYQNDNFVDDETGDPIDLTTGNGIAAMGVQIYGEEYAELGVDITSVKFDGKEMTLNGVSYTNDEDGGRRTNIYNEWASFDASNETNKTKDASAATPTLISVSDIGEWSTCEVTFTAYGGPAVAAAAPAAPAAGDVDAAATSSKGSPDTGIADVAAVAGIAVLAGAGIALSRKRK